MLTAAGLDARTFDPWVLDPPYAHALSAAAPTDLGPDAVDVVLALEVVEHLVDVEAFVADVGTVLAEGGCVTLSTGIYRPGLHGPEWAYLAREWGQHVTLWSQAALDHLAHRLGMHAVGLFPGRDGFLVILAPLGATALAARLATAAEILDHPSFAGRAASAWDLRSDGEVVAAEPVVRPARPAS
jgi:hypothetical protein